MRSKPKLGEQVALEIASVDQKGHGIGWMGEYAVGVPAAVPGDTVLARIRRVRHRGRKAEAGKEALIRAGIERQRARCSHFGTCGGCLWQDVPYEDQVALKQAMVENCLKEAGVDVAVDDPIPAEDPFFYRNKMEFSFGVSAEGEVCVGLHVRGRFEKVFDLESCYLQSERSNKIVARVREFVNARGLSAYDLHRHKGLLRFLTIREGKNTGETMVILTTSGEDASGLAELGTRLTDEFPEIKSVVRSVNRRKAQVAIGEEEAVISGRGTVNERLGEVSFEISPSSFFQTNSLQAEKLYERVVELVDPRPGDRVLDLYCGTGAISLLLSEHCGEVIGVEVSGTAVKDAVRNRARNGIQNCRFVAGRAEEALARFRNEGRPFDAAVVDPPRAGMHPRGLRALVDLRPETIVYISCNTEVLPGDLKRFEAGRYRPDYVQLVDMFPHTPHCEILVRLQYGRA